MRGSEQHMLSFKTWLHLSFFSCFTLMWSKKKPSTSNIYKCDCKIALFPVLFLMIPLLHRLSLHDLNSSSWPPYVILRYRLCPLALKPHTVITKVESSDQALLWCPCVQKLDELNPVLALVESCSWPLPFTKQTQSVSHSQAQCSVEAACPDWTTSSTTEYVSIKFCNDSKCPQRRKLSDFFQYTHQQDQFSNNSLKCLNICGTWAAFTQPFF